MIIITLNITTKVRKELLFELFANGNFLGYALKFIILHMHKILIRN
jgi:hypothetical protein